MSQQGEEGAWLEGKGVHGKKTRGEGGAEKRWEGSMGVGVVKV